MRHRNRTAMMLAAGDGILAGEMARLGAQIPPLWAPPFLGTAPAGQPAPTGVPNPAAVPPVIAPPAAPAAAPAQPGQPPAYTPPATQAELDALVEARLQRDRAARPGAPENLAQLQADSAELARLRTQHGTDQERAVAAAVTQAAQTTRDALLPTLIAAELRAASAGRLDDAAAAALVAPLNPAYFTAPDGSVDRAKVAQYAATAVATAPGAAPGQPAVPAVAPSVVPGWPAPAAMPPALPALGQGGTPPSPPSPAEQARLYARERFGDDKGPGR